ncbi:RNA polymerase III transcription initiation factor complex subunit [Podila clonocystis]|nr:RNA polymerase III transcription initiation factor complex subunit [Podila clonocystis]
MDDLVLHVQTEIALDGNSGCCWDRFWYLVDEFLQRKGTLAAAVPAAGANSRLSGRTDERFRQFFWDNFKEEEGNIIYKTKDPYVPQPDTDHSRASYVSIEGATEFSDEELYYQTIGDDTKQRIRIAATADRIQVALLGHSGSTEFKSEVGYKALQMITASREYGVTQIQMAKEMGLDPRSMFHFIKVLIEQKLVVKIPVTTGGTYTLLCLHKKFASQNSGFIAMNGAEATGKKGTSRPLVSSDTGARFEGLLKTDSRRVSFYSALVKQTITELLNQAKNQIMTVEDLAMALDLGDMTIVQNRWFNRQIELLCRLKYVKRVHVPNKYRCIQLIRMFGNGTIGDGGEKANLKAFMSDDSMQSGICVDTCIEQQVYQSIKDAGKAGIVAREIAKELNKLNRRLLAKILESLVKASEWEPEPLVHRIVEFVGRERRYRYYSTTAFNSTVGQEHKDYIDKAKLQTPTVKPRNKKGKKQVTTEPTNVTTTNTPAPDTAATTETAGPSAPNQNLQPSETSQAVEPSSVQGGESHGQDANSAQPAEPTVNAPGAVLAPEKFISIALLQRRKVIMTIMEQKRMVEIHATLVAEFHRQKNILFPGDQENVMTDRRTIFRAITVLETEGLLKIYKVDNVPMVGGGTCKKQFCLLPDISPDSEEVKQFVKDCSSRQMLYGSLANKPVKRLERMEVEVESLDQMATRLGSEFTGINIPFSEVGAVTPASKIREEGKSKLHMLGADFEGSQFAIQYGWFRAKMLRALVFHRFILDKLTVHDSNLYPYLGRPHILSTAPLLEVMPLRVFLQVVGIMIEPPTPECRQFLEENRMSNMPLQNLPSHTAFLALPSPAFTKRLREALEILDALGLVSPLDEHQNIAHSTGTLAYSSNHLVFHTHYEIFLDVAAPLDPIDPNDLERNLEGRKRYMLTSVKECRDFWVDLQTTASAMTFTGEVHVRYKSQNYSWDKIKGNFLHNLCNRRIWTDPIRITAGQQRILLNYASQHSMFIPVANLALLSQISTETALAKEHIVRFYKALMASWKRTAKYQAKVKAEKEAAKVKRRRPVRLRQVRMVVPVEDKPAEVIDAEARDAIRRRGLLGTDDPANPRGLGRGGKYSIKGKRKKRAKRTTWTAEDEDTLLMSTAIVRYIAAASNVRFSWYAPARCMPFTSNKTVEICRHRYAKLMRVEVTAQRLEYYRMAFAHLYPEIAKKFTIDTTNLVEYDPNPVLNYFRLKLRNPTDDLAHLPQALQTHQYAVRQHEPFASIYVEERIYKEESWHRQLLMLNLLPFTMRSMNPKELNYSQEELASPRTVTVDTPMGVGSAIKSEIQLRDEHLVRQNAVLTVIKTIYATPITRRSLDWTRAILETFDTALIQDACLRAKEWKVLVSVRGSTYRIPGQRVGRSERFTQIMAGAYPRAMSLAAADSARLFAGIKTWTFDEESSAADMMAITNEIAMDRVKLIMVPPSEPDAIKAPEAYFLNTRLTFDVVIENLGFQEKQSSPVISSLKRADRDDQEEISEGLGSTKRIKSIIEETEPEPVRSWTEVRQRTVAALEKYLGTVPDPQKRRLLQDIFTVVMASEAVGMTLIDIKASLDLGKGHQHDSDIVHAVRTLEGTSPSILLSVGTACERYVIFGWHERWCVDYGRILRSLDSEDNEYAVSETVNPVDWRAPRVWRTMDPELDKSVFEKSLHAILTMIADRPGVSKGTLQRCCYKIILPVELDEILEELERRKAITQRSGINPKPATLFSKPGKFVECHRDTIHERKVTSYFPEPGYYKYLDMDLVQAKGATHGHLGWDKEAEIRHRQETGDVRLMHA